MRILKTLVVFAVIATAIAPSWAQSFAWNGGISITESTDQSGIYSRIEAYRHQNILLGGWLSTTGVLAVINTGLTYKAYCDLPGIENIQKVALSPDGGKTQWPAEQIPGKRWCAVPCDLTPGPAGWVWGVWSKDRHNRVVLLIIPINWSSTRKSCQGSQLMIQEAPYDFDSLNDIQTFAHLRGFVPSWSTADPAVLVAQQMAMPSTLPPLKVDSQPTGSPIKLDGQVGANEPKAKKSVSSKSQLVSLTMTIVLGDSKKTWRNQTIDVSQIKEGTFIEFRRDGKCVTAAEVTVIDKKEKRLVMQITKGDYPTSGDQLFPIAEEAN